MIGISPIAERSRQTAPRLFVLTDAAVASGSVLDARLERLLANCRRGSAVVVLRDKQLPVRERLAIGRRLAPIVRRHGHELAVADRLDLAVLLEAEGAHLGESSVDTRDARALLFAGAWLSRATHDPARLDREADAMILSPIAAPRKGRPALGLAAIETARTRLSEMTVGPPPLLYALGGVDERNAAQCLAAGADGIAVIGAALDGRDPVPLTRALGIEAA